MTLRVALIGGPMYDGLYELLPGDVEVVCHADHPTLNREVAARLADGERLDLISTHGKYAPSQARWLRTLDELIEPGSLEPLAPRAVELCRFRGGLLCVPRNIDVRVLWWRTDRMEAAPATWADVDASPATFGFTGRESGLFGLFFEIVTAMGGALFTPAGTARLDGPEAQAAVELLCRLAARGPDDLGSWHYDEVDAALLDGRVDMAAAWPGGYGRIRASDLYDRLAPAPYPGGRSYSGCHGWAIPRTCGDLDGALDLLARLTSRAAADLEAAGGGVPAHRQALAEHRPVDGSDRARLEITRATIEHAMVTYPPLERFPEVEDAAWWSLHEAIVGTVPPASALRMMQQRVEEVLGA